MEKFGPLNLAKKPIRNRRFFYNIVIILILLSSFLFCFNFYSFIKSFNKKKEVERDLSIIKNKIEKIQRKDKLNLKKIKKLELKYGKEIEAINNLIFKKSFSWTDFFTRLEEILPKGTIVLSIRPELKEERVEIKLDFGARTINDFLALIESLRKNRFQKVQVKGERKDEKGFIVSSVSFFYEMEEL